MSRVIYGVAILLSLLMSFWINSHESVVNPDAICYLLSAQAMNETGFVAGMHLCGQASWPFYSFLIATLTKFSQLSYQASAYALDSVFSAFSVCLFIAIIKQLGGKARVIWLALAVILLSHEFNSIRQYIVRDHGYFAFYLAAFYFLLRFMQRARLMTALLFGASLAVAALFRIEGIIFLIVLPMLTWFNTMFTWRQRVIAYLKLNVITCFGVLLVLVFALCQPQHVADKLGRLPEIANQFQHGVTIIFTQLKTMKMGLAQFVLNRDSAHDAGMLLALMIPLWYLVLVINNVSWIYGFLVVYAWCKKIPVFSRTNALVIWGYVVANVLITFVFLLERLFLSSRYLIGLSLILMLWVPFALDEVLKKRLFSLIVGLLILVSAAGGIVDFGYSKSYIHEAGDWIAKNVSLNSYLYANDEQLLYYSHRLGTALFTKLPININVLTNNGWHNYDYIALRSSKKDEEKTASIVSEMKLQPFKVFENKRGDNVSIYRIHEGDKTP